VPEFTFGGTVSANENKSGGVSKKILLTAAAIVVIAAAGYVAWSQWGRPAATANVPTLVSQPVSQSLVRPSVPAQPAQSAVSQATIQTPNPDSSSAPQPKPATPAAKSEHAQVASAASAPVHSNKNNSSVNSIKSSISDSTRNDGAASDHSTAASEASQPIVIKTPSPQQSKVAAAPAVEPPSISMVATENAAIPNLGSTDKEPAPVLETLNVSQGVSQGLLVRKVQPIYPASALQMQIEGTVQLLATISKTGNITSVKVLSGQQQLAHAAVDAVTQWKYKPYLLNGSPVEIKTQITVNFKLPR
jgi:TonB family protein